jgi:hypothetical protein
MNLQFSVSDKQNVTVLFIFSTPSRNAFLSASLQQTAFCVVLVQVGRDVNLLF